MTAQLLVTLDEAARRLSLSRRFVQGEIYAGRMKSCVAGRRRLVAVADLEDYVDRLRQAGDEHAGLAVVGRSRTG